MTGPLVPSPASDAFQERYSGRWRWFARELYRHGYVASLEQVPPSPGDVVRRLLDAANAHDLDAVLRCSTELTATGTHTGPYLTVGGELLAPPGGHISVRGCWFSHLRDDLVAGQHLYYDQLEIYAPLGLRLPLSFGDDGA